MSRESFHFNRRIDHLGLALVSRANPPRNPARDRSKLMDARDGGFVPSPKLLHEKIHQPVFARVCAVQVEIAPGVTHGGIHITEMACAIVDSYPMRNRVAKSDHDIIMTQLKTFNG